MNKTLIPTLAAAAVVALAACGGSEGGQSQASAEFFAAVDDAPTCAEALAPGQPVPTEACYAEATDTWHVPVTLGFDCPDGRPMVFSAATEPEGRFVAVDGTIVAASIDPADYSMADIEAACEAS